MLPNILYAQNFSLLINILSKALRSPAVKKTTLKYISFLDFYIIIIKKTLLLHYI